MGDDWVGVIGLGRMGQALAVSLLRTGHPVVAWDRTEAVRAHWFEALRDVGSGRPGVRVVGTAPEVAVAARTIMIGVPASAVAPVVEALGPALRPDHELVLPQKGVGEGFLLPADAVRDGSCVRRVAVLGGPMIATEMAAGHRQAILIGARFDALVHRVKTLLAWPRCSFFSSADLVGIQVAGAIRNVSAIIGGVASAVGATETARALLLTRGLHEAARFGALLGAERETFMGLAAVGDLVARREESYSRNFRLGLFLGRGEPVEEILRDLGGEPEGLRTARAAALLGDRKQLQTPLAHTVIEVANGADPRLAIEALLSGDLELATETRR